MPSFSFTDIFWLVFIVLVLLPALKMNRVERARIKLIRKIERQRGSRVITLIHRQEPISFLGIPLTRFINIEDSEQILRAIRLTPECMPIDLILHTPGGLVLASEQIARALQKHPAKVTVFIPHYAMSGGTMVALAADEIIMDENAVMGPVDPQIGDMPAASIIETVREKGPRKVDDRTLILADVSSKALKQVYTFMKYLLEKKMSMEKATVVARLFSSGQWTHDYPITYRQLADIELNVNTNMHREIYTLMDLFPQAQQRRPSVQFIPEPYHRERDRDRNKN
ncbi:MAG TPA: hypothetical protein VFD15_03920 [Clostridia bacterium]|nr:hypothetical protein [Clostridia bacterium]